MSRPAAGGGRWVSVAPERLARWLDGFAERHGVAVEERSGVSDEGSHGAAYKGSHGAAVGGRSPSVVTWTAADGAVAEVEVPFPPLAGDLVAHALLERRVGVVLARRGGHAVGVAAGRRLVVAKVGRRQVHGRSAAGGWSQQRFARRREGQVRVAHAAAAQTAYEVLVPHAATLDAVVLGGERSSVEAVMADPRLAPLAALVTGRLLDVPDPRQAVLAASPDLLRQVHIRVVEG